jgi:hypothetical protein
LKDIDQFFLLFDLLFITVEVSVASLITDLFKHSSMCRFKIRFSDGTGESQTGQLVCETAHCSAEIECSVVSSSFVQGACMEKWSSDEELDSKKDFKVA